MKRDRYRALTAAAVLLVAAIAAVVSYLHIVTLALRYGQEPLAAYLLPLSIDGLVATSSLVMLRSARSGASAPWLARSGLVLAVVATLGANVASGLAHGWPGALLAGWPACAFIVSAETAISMSRRQPVTTPTQTGSRTGPLSAVGQVAGPVRDRPDEPVRTVLPKPVRDGRANRSAKPVRTVTGDDAEREFATEIATGQVPSLYQIRNRLHVGNERAKKLRQHIARQALST